MLPAAKVKPCKVDGLEYPLADTPAPGAAREVAPGVYWLRMPVVFKRALDTQRSFFAMGEILSHLNYLRTRWQLEREAGTDGIYRFVRA